MWGNFYSLEGGIVVALEGVGRENCATQTAHELVKILFVEGGENSGRAEEGHRALSTVPDSR